MVAVAQLLRQILPLLIFVGSAATGLTKTLNSSATVIPEDSTRGSSETLFSTSSSTSTWAWTPTSSTNNSVLVDVPVLSSSDVTKREWLLGSNESSLSRSLRIKSEAKPSLTLKTSSASSAISAISAISAVHASSTIPTNEVGLSRTVSGRGARDVTESPCYKFENGSATKKEFYSPNWPDNYPNQTDCVRVLEADKGMLLTLGFRDRFDMEPSENCHFDFLEVRDGQHGYATLLGLYCGKQFPPELTSKTRFLWLHFHSDENIEYGGFRAVWNMIPRPTDKGVPPEPEACLFNVSGHDQAIFGSNDTEIQERKKFAESNGVALDCMWAVTVEPDWKIQLNFSEFGLAKPNECDANFIDVFDGRTDMPSRAKNFCGSIADLVSSKTNKIFIRFYIEPRAFESKFTCFMTAFREKTDKSCTADEYDCEDARCISKKLRCNGVVNCRFRWDEDGCVDEGGGGFLDKEHIVIILVVFSLIMFGMSFAFVFNCVRKLIRDHRIIQEHIRQSRENRLDEIGRKTTPCPLATTRVDSREHRGSSESPSLEVAPSKELLPPPPPSSCALMAHEYARELLAREAEYSANCKEMNDIHRSNNASNATQERLQESSEEPETRDNSCQTRESLFDGASPPRRQPSASQSHCSGCGCSPASTCVRHSALIASGIPPPPHGWSIHDQRYPPAPEPPDYLCSYQRFQSPKPTPTQTPSRDKYHSPGKYSRQSTLDSGTTTVGSSQHSSGSTVPSNHGSMVAQTNHGSQGIKQSGRGKDPRYRAEAVIELPEQDRRPFSIESTKSAPDVIATH